LVKETKRKVTIWLLWNGVREHVNCSSYENTKTRERKGPKLWGIDGGSKLWKDTTFNKFLNKETLGGVSSGCGD